MWEQLSMRAKLMILSGESLVEFDLLVESDALLALLRRGASKEAVLEYVNVNW